MSSYKVISADDFDRRYKAGQVHLIDVRNPPEFAGGHVDGALLCPLGELNPEKILADLQAKGFGTDDTLYVLCQAGMRARQAADFLCKATDAEIVVVEGGTQACQSIGMPIRRA